ncbi:EVE domain-containing protein [Pseudomonas sp. 148P]|uniref:EVE domain-containing protein n=1 Tax=Pseudomonas ulcerans TaxID=3115852 RepID=A0ABU7HP52_9PSED|nr:MULTISPECIES: EVE domain-containing protein [unclassified Pseudomonas]MEE1920501.1 EVE domain-containing protein [Pseudomonas sp. 147P]MEE1933283.1 EVE domain-containing protein [Pseudomonas sp. 148P]
MNVFVFQSVPERFDLRKAVQPGQTDTWYATRYRNEMQPGDLVFFWMAGDEHFRGLYGWGLLTSSPYLKSGWDSHGVDVRYEAKFAKPILAKTIRNDEVLAEMLIFRAPQATNFLLSAHQAKRLIRVIHSRGEEAPDFGEIDA